LCFVDWYGGWYLRFAEFCRMLIDAQQGVLTWSNGHPRSERDIWEAWGTTNLVVLDEIGTRNNPSDFQVEVLHQAIDARENKPVVFVSNLDLEDVCRVYGDRIASRLSRGTLIEFEGDQRADPSLKLVTCES
jgi:DNA replication protein DnaC